MVSVILPVRVTVARGPALHTPAVDRLEVSHSSPIDAVALGFRTKSQETGFGHDSPRMGLFGVARVTLSEAPPADQRRQGETLQHQRARMTAKVTKMISPRAGNGSPPPS